MTTLFNEKPKEEYVEQPYKAPAISPFDFINAIHYSKENLIVDDWSEKQYNAYLINRGLSFGHDTVIQANEMNSRPHLDKALQFNFLLGAVRSRKRFNKWIKPEKIYNIEIIKEYYGYSNKLAEEVLHLFTVEDINKMKENVFKGGNRKS